MASPLELHVSSSGLGLGQGCSKGHRSLTGRQLWELLKWTQPWKVFVGGRGLTPSYGPCPLTPLRILLHLLPSSQHVSQPHPLWGPHSAPTSPSTWSCHLHTHLPSPRPQATITATLALTFDAQPLAGIPSAWHPPNPLTSPSPCWLQVPRIPVSAQPNLALPPQPTVPGQAWSPHRLSHVPSSMPCCPARGPSLCEHPSPTPHFTPAHAYPLSCS